MQQLPTFESGSSSSSSSGSRDTRLCHGCHVAHAAVHDRGSGWVERLSVAAADEAAASPTYATPLAFDEFADEKSVLGGSPAAA